MKIEKIDCLGLTMKNGTWIRYDHPNFPKGIIYTEEEFLLEIDRRLQKQKSIRLEKYQILETKMKEINKILK